MPVSDKPSARDALILFALPFLLYSGSIGYELLGLDDQIYYLSNPSLHGGRIGGLWGLWRSSILSDYSPVSQLTLWLDLALFGSEQWHGARLHSLAWFGLGTLGVQACALTLTGNRKVAFAAALLYALHPACTPSVLWLAQRKNLVAFALVLWCFHFYIKDRARAEGLRLWPQIAAVILGVLALLAKPHATALPVMLFAYELTLGTGSWVKRGLRLIPFAAAAALFVAVSLLMLRQDLDRSFLGGSRAAALASDGPILLRYLWHTIAPVDLAFYYAVEELPAWSWYGWGAALAVLLIAAATVRLSNDRRLMTFCWFCAAAALSPALNLVPQLAPMADHYLQWALPWLLLGCCHLVDGKLPAANHHWRPIIAGAAGIYFAVLSFARVDSFRSTLTLYQAAVARQPGSALNWAGYATALANVGTVDSQRLCALAALNALRCADAHRLMAQQRSLAIREAALLLFNDGKRAEAWQFTLDETAKFHASDRLFALLTKAEVAARTDKPELAISLLQDELPPEIRQAAQDLLGKCGSGEVLPDELPPILSLSGTGADAYAQSWGSVLGLRMLHIFSAACINAGRYKEGFGAAALLLNLDPGHKGARQILAVAYRGMGKPEAAEKISRKPIVR